MLCAALVSVAWRPSIVTPPARHMAATRSVCARMEQDDAAWAQLADDLERAVAVSKELASSSSASPSDASPEAALDALRKAAGQRMEDRMGEEGGTRGFSGVKRLVASLTDSLVEAKARLSDMSTRLEQADAAAAAATARAETAEAAEAATAAELQQNVIVLAGVRAGLRHPDPEPHPNPDPNPERNPNPNPSPNPNPQPNPNPNPNPDPNPNQVRAELREGQQEARQQVGEPAHLVGVIIR